MACLGLVAALAGCTAGGDDADATESASPPTTTSAATPTPAAAPRTPGVPQVDEAGSVLEIIRTRNGLAAFAQLVEAFLAPGGREGVFLQERGVTILAPRTISDDVVAALQADDRLLSLFIGEHLIVGDVAAAELRPRITTANGSVHRATRRRLGGQELAARNLRASNGRVHVVAGPLVTLSELTDG